MKERYFVELPTAHLKAVFNRIHLEAMEIDKGLGKDGVEECKMVRAMMHQLGTVAALSMSGEMEHREEMIESLFALAGMAVLYAVKSTNYEEEKTHDCG